MRVDRAPIGETNGPGRAVHLQAGHLARGQHLGAELRGLPPGPVGELRPRYPIREAQVVLDPRALPRLTSGREPLHQHGAQPLRSAVHRGAQPGRPAADDDQVVEVVRRRCGQPNARSQLSIGWLDQRVAVRGDHHRQRAAVRSGSLEQPLTFRFLGHVPAVRHLVAGEELAHLRRAR